MAWRIRGMFGAIAMFPDRRCGQGGKASSIPELLAALREDLGGDLIGAVSARQTDQGLAVSVAVVPHVPEGMARPADRQQDQRHARAGDGRLERRDRLVLLRLDP